ncbi:MAG: PorV/PorQ family protein [Calditrichaeota bacterium]|nr:PorV/PorQ family protein [Calditrichota bacterium]
MKPKIIITVLLITVASVNLSIAQTSSLNQTGTSMANFLKIGVGGRALGMGSAYVALANDVTATYWNPGGLGFLTNNQLYFQTTNWLLDTKLFYLATSYRLPQIGNFGFHIYTFSSGQMAETTIWEPEGTGRQFDASNFAAGLTFSRQLTNRFSAGLTIKYISERLDRETARTVAIDIGSIFITDFFNNMRLGFALSNLGGRMQLHGTDLIVQHLEDPSIKYSRAELLTDPWDIPLLFRFGVATDIVNADNFRLTFSSELMDSRDFIHRIATGGEICIKKMLTLRSGYRFNDSQAGLSVGAGFDFQLLRKFAMKLDYAYNDYQILNNVQTFSIILTF